VDESTVSLSYMEGEAVPASVPSWASATGVLTAVSKLVKDFSLAAVGVGDEVSASDWLGPVMAAGDVLVHGDPHPTNVVFDESRQPTSLIDFELATLGSHECNLVSLLFTWGPLEPQELTSWQSVAPLDVRSRVAAVLDEWRPTCPRTEILETGRAFVAWRMAMLRNLAAQGNRGARLFVDDPTFDRRYEHCLHALAAALARR
jgi:hypothetical protein